MAKFKKPDENTTTPTETYSRNPKDEQLGIFKSILLRMIKQGKTIDAVVEFTKNPASICKGEESPLDQVFISGILTYTTLEERKKVLLDLEKSGQI